MIQQILRFASRFESRQLYFWMGFLAGGLFFWIISKLRVALPLASANLKKKIAETRRSLSISTEARLRSDILRLAQHMHLASPLFALDEVAILPHLIAPPLPPPVKGEERDTEGTETSLPYLPDWPELVAAYKSPTLTLPEALSQGANLILIGAPGSGKTVALAYMASQIARQAAELGALAGSLPLLVQASDISLPEEPAADLLDPLVAAIAFNASPFTQPRLPAITRSAFERGSAFLLLDGLDELPPPDVPQIVRYLGAVLEKYPATRIIASASPEDYAGLIALGLAPVAIAAWSEMDRTSFIHRWGEMWQRYISPGLANPTGELEPVLLESWLSSPDLSITPLELTLKTWAAYAGDAHGSSVTDWIQSYVLRTTSELPKASPALEKLAFHMLAGSCAAINIREAQKWAPETTPSATSLDQLPVSDGDLPSNVSTTTASAVPQSLPGAGEPADNDSPSELPARPVLAGAESTTQEGKAISTAPQMLMRLVESGVLVSRMNSRVSFVHPVIAGYLAGKALASSGDFEVLNSQPEWAGKSLAMRFLSTFTDTSDMVLPSLVGKSDPLFRKLLQTSRWLKDAPKNSRWRSQAMRELAGLLQKEMLPVGLRARALAALIYSGDSGTLVLLRSLLISPLESVRRLAAIGCGLARDAKAVKDLIGLLDDPAQSVKMAAMMALAAIGSSQALEAIADELLHGTEEMRRAAAEVLANHPEEGHPALSDGSTMPDILVRRAVVYGLARVNQPWANQILEKMQIEDEQWVVRTAAIGVLEEMLTPDPRIPRPIPPQHQMPWLIEYAGKQGIGVTPGKPAMDLVVASLRSQDKEDQLAALVDLACRGDSSCIPNIYPLLFSRETDLQDAAYQTLWELSASGVPLPPPEQFGYIF